MSSLLSSILSGSETESYSKQYQKLSQILEEIKKIQESDSPDLDKVVDLLAQATEVYKSCSQRLKVIEESMQLDHEDWSQVIIN